MGLGRNSHSRWTEGWVVIVIRGGHGAGSWSKINIHESNRVFSKIL